MTQRTSPEHLQACVGANFGTPTTAKPGAMEREDWNQRYAAQEFIWTVEANRFLIAETEKLNPGTALDLGAGEGRNAVWLAERGWIVHALDFSSVALDKGRRLAEARNVSGHVYFVEADLRRYGHAGLCFDLVALIYMQMPQSELVPIIKQAVKAVAPNGTFLLVAHDSINLTRGFGGPKDPAMLYSAEDVVAAIGDALIIEKAGRVDRPVETANGTRIAIDCLVRATRRP